MAPGLCYEHPHAEAELPGRGVFLAAAGVNCGKGLASAHWPLPPFVQAFPHYGLLCPAFPRIPNVKIPYLGDIQQP